MALLFRHMSPFILLQFAQFIVPYPTTEKEFVEAYKNKFLNMLSEEFSNSLSEDIQSLEPARPDLEEELRNILDGAQLERCETAEDLANFTARADNIYAKACFSFVTYHRRVSSRAVNMTAYGSKSGTGGAKAQNFTV